MTKRCKKWAVFGHTFYTWPTFYRAGNQLFTARLVLCLNFVVHIQYTFYYFSVNKKYPLFSILLANLLFDSFLDTAPCGVASSHVFSSQHRTFPACCDADDTIALVDRDCRVLESAQNSSDCDNFCLHLIWFTHSLNIAKCEKTSIFGGQILST